jgi:hypothetical protein
VLHRILWFLVLGLVVIPVHTFADEAPASPERNRTLLSLYATYATLQMLDAHSTTRGLDRGLTEANPLARGVAHQPAALVALKAGGAASTIWLANKLSKRSRTRAIVLMAAMSSGYAMVVARNYHAAP